MVSVQIRTVKQNALALIQFGNATREPADHFVKIIFSCHSAVIRPATFKILLY
jgi:hypothetical protein